ncbi:MAG: hypothetical protein WBP79_01325 [Candidatus Acidiferrales bacterium]
MAGLSFSPEARGQFAAIARLRWQLFVNSLRTLRGRFELISKILISLGFAAAGLAGAFSLGFGAWALISHGKFEWLALLLWGILMFWQAYPMLASPLKETVDSSNLLRFPLRYPAYFVVRLVFGALDPSTALGFFWLTGILIGIGIVAPPLALWAAIVLLVFANLNILLSQMIFAWLERWLMRRRTREILGVVFFLVLISFQLIGPLMGRYGNGARPTVAVVFTRVLPVQRVLPPGLAAAAIARAIEGKPVTALGAFGALCAYGALFFALLNLRLRAQYLGENLSEAVAPTALRKKESIRPGWSLTGLSGPVAAIFEKEIRYLSRSGPMLFTLIMPVFILLIFRLGPANSGRGGASLANAPDLAFPIGAAYALLILTNLVYNNFGADGTGVQIFFAAPVRFREIVLAKNLAHVAVLTFVILLVWFGVCLMFRPPSVEVTLATLSGILFALPVNLSVGNLLSIYSPKKYDFGAFGRQRAPQATVIVSLTVQFVVFGLAALIFLVARHRGEIWLATIAFLALAAIAFGVYFVFLGRAEKMALDRREVMIAELSKA